MNAVLKKQSTRFTDRLKSSIREFNFTMWLFPLALIVFPLAAIIGYREYSTVKMIIAIVLGIIFAILLMVLAFRHSRYYITQIDIGDTINIEVQKYNEKLTLKIEKNNFSYLTRPEGKGQTAQIRFLNKNKVILTQYKIANHWEWADILKLEHYFKSNGILKPYGENL